MPSRSSAEHKRKSQPNAIIVPPNLVNADEIAGSKDRSRQREKELATLLENLPDAIIRLDRDKRVHYANPAVAALTGCPSCASLGSLEELGIPSDQTSLLYAYIDRAFAGCCPQTFEIELEGTANPARIFQVQLVPEFDPFDQMETVLMLSRDITDRRLVEREMARFEQLNIVGEMAASIGHEVRNPMTTVRGFLQMLRGKRGDCADYTEYFDIMIDELDRANHIITQFLSLAKDKLINMENTSLNSIITTLYPLLNAEAVIEGKMVELCLNTIPLLTLDQKEIRQMILNLARNGLEAMKPGGAITISTHVADTEVIMAITDQGPGIPANILDKIDKPFFTTKENGTGLGLAVCYRIAAHHNAVIRVLTGNDGTTFSVAFPLSKAIPVADGLPVQPQ